MKFGTWLLVIILVYGLFSTRRSVRRSQSEAERFFAIRISAVTWLLGFVCLAAGLFLPGRQVLLLAIPLFFAGVTLAKLWRDGRARLQREQGERDALERMKRIN